MDVHIAGVTLHIFAARDAADGEVACGQANDQVAGAREVNGDMEVAVRRVGGDGCVGAVGVDLDSNFLQVRVVLRRPTNRDLVWSAASAGKPRATIGKPPCYFAFTGRLANDCCGTPRLSDMWEWVQSHVSSRL